MIVVAAAEGVDAAEQVGEAAHVVGLRQQPLHHDEREVQRHVDLARRGPADRRLDAEDDRFEGLGPEVEAVASGVEQEAGPEKRIAQLDLGRARIGRRLGDLGHPASLATSRRCAELARIRSLFTISAAPCASRSSRSRPSSESAR